MPDFKPELHVLNAIHCSPVLFRFEFITCISLGHTNKHSTSLTDSSQPQAKLPMFQQKANNEVYDPNLLDS